MFKKILILLLILVMTVGVVCASEDVNDTSATADADDSITQPIDDNCDSNASSDLLEASDEDELSDEGEFLDVSDAYDCLNSFRCEEGVWQWDSDDATKTYFNTNDTIWLHPMLRDVELEETAKIRAKELVEMYAHTRPDGTSCFSAFPEGLGMCGENIAVGYVSCEDVTEAWKETNDPFEWQGHRRNMLNPSFNSVGIAAYKMNGNIYWVQDFARRYNPSSVEGNPFAIEDNGSATPKFTVKLPVYATGYFAVSLNGSEIMRKSVFQGKAEIVIYGLNEGSYDVVMSYEGDDNYKQVNATGTVYSTGDDSQNASFTYLNTLLKISGNEVTLQKDYAFDENTDSELVDGITFSEFITIDANGHRIDAKGKARIFLAYGGLRVKNAELANGVADYYGGAVLSYGLAFLDNCTFTNNSAGKWGGAVCAARPIYETNSRFIDNSAYDVGGAMFGQELVSVDGSTFINNRAGNLGGAVFAGGTLHNENTVYINNTNLQRYSSLLIFGDGNTVDDEYSLVFANATVNNGVVNLNRDWTATQTILVNASNVTINGNGYSIDASNRMRIFYITGDNVTIRNITLSGAKSISEGGAIYAYSNNTFIIDSAFKGNRAETGAAISTKGNVFIKSSNFTDNVAEAGGAVFSDMGNVSVISSVFKNNDALSNRGGGGGAIYTTAGVYITDSLFTENDAVLYGGAIFTNGKDFGRIYIDGSTFANNTALDGGVMVSAIGAEISNSSFTNNSAGRHGGIISTRSEVTVKSSNFTDNSAGGDGGVFQITKGNAMIEESIFTSNTADGSGGVLKITGNVTIADSVLCDNSAQASGGAVMGSGYVDVADSEFTNNTAFDDAGAIKVSGNAYVSDSIFQNNKANVGSGAISSENIMGSNTNFTNNEGGNGKTFSGNTLLNNSKIIENDVDVTSSYIGGSDNQNGSGNASGEGAGNSSGNSSGGSPSGPAEVPSANSVKVIKKATKITAGKKTFKAKAKTKKYTITLKSGKNPVKNVMVYLKIKGKTFKAKTNNNGKATFNIKFKKKGTIQSKITFKGNKYYLKSSKNVKIKFK